MSQENVKRLDRVFELLSEPETDWEALAEFLDPDIVWEVRADFPDAGVYTGYDRLRRFSEAFDAALEQTWYRPLEYIQAGSHVVVPLRWGGLGKGSQTRLRNMRRRGFSHSATAGSAASGSTRPNMTPSKPWGCGSSSIISSGLPGRWPTPKPLAR